MSLSACGPVVVLPQVKRQIAQRRLQDDGHRRGRIDAVAALVEELVVVVPAEQVDDAFLQDLDRPPLSAKRSEYPLPCRIDSDMQGGRLLLKPDQPLEYGQAYLVVVSAAVCDLAGNPLVDTLQTDERGRVIGLQTHFTHRFQIRQAPDDPENTRPSGPVFDEGLANPPGTERECA